MRNDVDAKKPQPLNCESRAATHAKKPQPLNCELSHSCFPDRLVILNEDIATATCLTVNWTLGARVAS